MVVEHWQLVNTKPQVNSRQRLLLMLREGIQSLNSFFAAIENKSLAKLLKGHYHQKLLIEKY